MNADSSKPAMVRMRRWKYLIFIYLGLAFAISAFCNEYRMLHQFYIDTASLTPGTEIRPMGFELALGITETTSLILGVLFAIVSFVLALRNRNWFCLGIALLTFVLSVTPTLFGTRIYQQIITKRKLVLEE